MKYSLDDFRGVDEATKCVLEAINSNKSIGRIAERILRKNLSEMKKGGKWQACDDFAESFKEQALEYLTKKGFPAKKTELDEFGGRFKDANYEQIFAAMIDGVKNDELEKMRDVIKKRIPEKHKCEGWNDYPTCLVNLNIDNTEATFMQTSEIFRDAARETHNLDDFTQYVAKAYKKLAEKALRLGLCPDMVGHWLNADYQEIAGAAVEDLDLRLMHIRDIENSTEKDVILLTYDDPEDVIYRCFPDADGEVFMTDTAGEMDGGVLLQWTITPLNGARQEDANVPKP